jgi:hypothetical protein
LEHAAVDHDQFIASFDAIAGTSDLTICTQKVDLHSFLPDTQFLGG